ncbi:hypothetical protein G6F35_017412 [Rhizopus arrhizus]|nr:hypothetical protein G6F31_018837 [Rhizopus arrhizus]KAG1168687.1 hypothetical protein G6F35_017412 [Rhizopus arrhizus]
MRRRAVGTQRHQPLRIVSVDIGDHGDRASLDHRTAGPGKHQADARAPCPGQVQVFAARTGIGRAQFRIAQGADQHHQAARAPQRDIHGFGTRVLRDQRRKPEDADADHDPDQYDDGVHHR